MRTQAEILERMRTTKNDDTYGTGLLYLFLDRASQVELYGKRLMESLGDKGIHEPLTENDVEAMLRNLLTQARTWSHEDTIQKMRKQRLRALVWLVDDDARFDWTKTAQELVSDIEGAYAQKG